MIQLFAIIEKSNQSRVLYPSSFQSTSPWYIFFVSCLKLFNSNNFCKGINQMST